MQHTREHARAHTQHQRGTKEQAHFKIQDLWQSARAWVHIVKRAFRQVLTMSSCRIIFKMLDLQQQQNVIVFFLFFFMMSSGSRKCMWNIGTRMLTCLALTSTATWKSSARPTPALTRCNPTATATTWCAISSYSAKSALASIWHLRLPKDDVNRPCNPDTYIYKHSRNPNIDLLKYKLWYYSSNKKIKWNTKKCFEIEINTVIFFFKLYL